MLGALITGWDWIAVVCGFTLAGAALAAWEVRGIVRHDAHLVDTISEIYWKLRDSGEGWFKAGLATTLGGALVWIWWHFTFEGRQRRGTESDV